MLMGVWFYMPQKSAAQHMYTQHQTYTAGVEIQLKAQYPIQNAVNLTFNTQSGVSAFIGVGQLSRLYVRTATEFLPEDDPNLEARKRFIQDKLQNGFVFELGTAYHFKKLKDVYIGLSLQFQRFSLPATPQELVEEYDFGDTQGFLTDILDVVGSNDLFLSFYEDTEIKPIVQPIQLGLRVGKIFHFKHKPRWALGIEVSFLRNIGARTKLVSPRRVVQFVIDRFLDPIVEEGTDEIFDDFNLPSLSVSLHYKLGKKRR